MQTIVSNSEEETKNIAFKLAKQISHGVIALTGELGAGKTTFAAGFAKGLGIKEKIISPTFILIRSHKIPQTDKTLYHIDLCRLENKNHLKDLGLEEIINNSKNIVMIEWAEKIEKNLLKQAIKVNIQKKGANTRSITLA